MSGIVRLSFVLAAAVLGILAAASTRAAAPEWNAVRTHGVQIGPSANRLVVGFRATSANAVVRSIKMSSRPEALRIVQAATSAADVAGLAQRARLALARSRQLTPSMHVMYLQKTLYGASVNAALKALRADPAVEYADVDQRRYAHSVPNDPLFAPPAGSGSSGQWFMAAPGPATVNGVATTDWSATDAVSAWGLTTGSAGTVIADVDTGVRFDHPDLLRAGFGGRLLPGYDFVDQDYNRSTGAALGTFLIANDGDGWDPDPSDPGDWIDSTDQQNGLFPSADCAVSDSSWHGTRVMGVLGALTNNGVGVAGMTWNPYLLPVRALGKCGGYDSDIITGMQWAAGLSVMGVPDNPYPAGIINLSIGGSGACPSDYQAVIKTLTAMNVLVVASAGNENGPVDAPADCAGVLAVAGLRNVGTKVGYSSLGPEVGIAAPAGNCVNASGACLRSIDTTVNVGLKAPGANGYSNQTNINLGTSFSAPIVAGVAGLMRAVNANLTPPQLIARMEASASAFPPNTANVPVCPNVDAVSGECSCVPGQCGAGMVNARNAVSAALAPIAVIKAAGGGVQFDGSASVAACHSSIASYAWTASGGVAISSGAGAPQVSVASNGSPGTLTLTVTDSAGRADTGTVSFSADGTATLNAPSSAGTATTACPIPLTVTPAAPTVSEAFSPASVGQNVASVLTISFNNPNAFDLTQLGFTETVPADLVIQSSPAPTTTCTGGTGTLSSSASIVGLQGAIIPANGSCTLTLSVKGATAGDYANDIAVDALSTGPAGGNAAGATASLSVTAPAKGGGGEIDWWDMMFVAGVLLVGRRYAGRRPPS